MTCPSSIRSRGAAAALAVALVGLLTGALPVVAVAQAASDTARHIASDGTLLRPRDAVLLGTFALGATVAYHNDRGIARAFQRRDLQDNRSLHNTAVVLRHTGQPGVLLGGLATYAIGRITHRRVLATTGLRVTEAIVVTGTLTSLGKYVAGRSRPFVTAGADPGDFQWWRGRKEGYTSMPSGHTSAAFATASALSAEWRAAAPRSARVAVPLLYAGATMVGLSRMYNNKHWASDVVVGAALGTLTGRVVTRWGRAHPGNRVERWLVPLRVAPGAGGRVHIQVSLDQPVHLGAR